MAQNITSIEYTKHTGNTGLAHLRADAIMCNAVLEHAVDESSTYVTKDDLAEFTQHIEEMHKTLIDFVVSSALNFVSSDSESQQSGLEQEVQRLLEV